MALVERQPWYRRYAVRALTMGTVGIALLTQGLLVGGWMLGGMFISALERTAQTHAMALLLVAWLVGVGFVMAWLGRRFAHRAPLPSSPWWRYGPLLLYPLLIWLWWVISMHLVNGDFTRLGHSPIGMVLLPYLVLMFAVAFGATPWLLLGIPLVAHTGFVAGVWQVARRQPGDRTPAARASVFGLVALVAGLAGVTAWQAWQRYQVLAPLRGEPVSEEVDLYRYRPYAPHNLLKSVQPRPTLQFGLNDAPRLDGATAAYPVYAAAAQALYTEEAAKAKVDINKTQGAYQRLMSGDTDLIFAAQASPEQLAEARQRGVALVFTPVAKEAFVFLAHPDNPVQGLTLAQIRAIYSGQTRRWREVGGADAEIVAFQREANSGSQTVMQAKVMQGQPLMQPPQEERVQSMGGLVRRVASYRNAERSLGYSFRYYTTQMQAGQAVRLLAVDGVEPTLANIQTGRYPLTVDVFMVTRGEPAPNVRRLMDWFLSDAGQKLVADVGYVPLR